MANQNQIQLDLRALKDKEGNTYYGCFPDIPISFRLDEVIIFVYIAENGEESLVIRKKDANFANDNPRKSRKEDDRR